MERPSVTPNESFVLHPIGTVRRGKESMALEILPAYRPALLGLDQFSHVIALWWATGNDNPERRNHLQVKPRYAPERTVGVFACRAPFRPNPILMTTCEILSVDEEAGLVCVRNIDALDGTPLLDLKPYIATTERVRDPRHPEELDD